MENNCRLCQIGKTDVRIAKRALTALAEAIPNTVVMVAGAGQWQGKTGNQLVALAAKFNEVNHAAPVTGAACAEWMGNLALREGAMRTGANAQLLDG
jgi:hypothetical protein